MVEKLIDDEMHTVESVIKKYERLVFKLADRFSGNDYHHKFDLAQVGFIGLLESFKRFDDKSDVKFTTYAYKYIRGYMRNLNRENGIIHVPAGVKETTWKIDKQGLWDYDDEYIAKLLNVELRHVESCRIFFSLKSVLSMEAGNEEDEEANLYKSVSYDQDLSNPNVSYYIEKLNPRELFIVDRLMKDDSYSDIGAELGITKVRVGQLVKNIRVKVAERITNENF
ncbi:sigma-70 family RNA polymerase sigma factor [Sporosarcina sp. E16_8]|uniref:sigma-70 family RNA polymerase sigma factor n=1 Tax=Sporosarcina sp. E16_8 TaxID=2789295 RepID=UPI001A914C69|nr:sigma-70 family RNA polymerase sigma factor [Sporosarcina sp. E16_8]MBO0586138.1 sigma-70 family RNA polymerase sigma factor [Sporosarcina sp. E16_8]